MADYLADGTDGFRSAGQSDPTRSEAAGDVRLLKIIAGLKHELGRYAEGWERIADLARSFGVKPWPDARDDIRVRRSEPRAHLVPISEWSLEVVNEWVEVVGITLGFLAGSLQPPKITLRDAEGLVLSGVGETAESSWFGDQIGHTILLAAPWRWEDGRLTVEVQFESDAVASNVSESLELQPIVWFRGVPVPGAMRPRPIGGANGILRPHFAAISESRAEPLQLVAEDCFFDQEGDLLQVHPPPDGWMVCRWPFTVPMPQESGLLIFLGHERSPSVEVHVNYVRTVAHNWLQGNVDRIAPTEGRRFTLDQQNDCVMVAPESTVAGAQIEVCSLQDSNAYAWVRARRVQFRP